MEDVTVCAAACRLAGSDELAGVSLNGGIPRVAR